MLSRVDIVVLTSNYKK